MSKSNPPWSSGPGEILRHGVELLTKESDTNRRLAMISIDNAVELMMKTYLGLPHRVTGLRISKRELEEMSQSFPSLLDGIEKHAVTKLQGIELGEIEWYHRLRNELYHDGNGLTVERNKVEIYSQLAMTLFRNLFDHEPIQSSSPEAARLGDFMKAWTTIEQGLRDIASKNSRPGRKPTGLFEIMRLIRMVGLLPKAELADLENLRQIRNDVVHGARDLQTTLTPDVLERASRYAARYSPQTSR